MKNLWKCAVAMPLAGMLAPHLAHACACGCGVFDVGTSSMLPEGPGGIFFLQDAFQNQDRNWHGSSQAPAANNSDLDINTHFISVGLQYMFNREWGFQAEVPWDTRQFKTMDDAGNLVSRRWNQLGDIRIEGIYTGFSPDLSAGVTFGLKLPTGNYKFDPDVVDRDTQIGTGSTDLLLGGFYRGDLTRDLKWEWFTQAQLDLPALVQDDYRPGVEFDAAAGVDYKGIRLGRLRISPVAQVIFSARGHDSGANSADPVASGYQRVMLSPGIEFHLHPVMLYADAEIPVYQNFTGNQLAAPFLFKMSLAWMF